MIKLDKVNPQFRQIADLLLFSDRTDLDLSNFSSLLKENPDNHYKYLWEKFKLSCEVFWENSDIWLYRFNNLFNLLDKDHIKVISSFLEKRFHSLVISKREISVKYDISYVQLLKFSQVKYERGEKFSSLRNYFLEISSQINLHKLINIINTFIPYVFEDLSEYSESILNRTIRSARNIELLVCLDQFGLPLKKEVVVSLANDLLMNKQHSSKDRNTILSLINIHFVSLGIKEKYTQYHHDKILSLIKELDYHIIENFHLRNFKNLIYLDQSLADKIALIYIEKLFNRPFTHKKSNSDKIIRLLKTCPQISAKKVIAYLASINRVTDIKYIISEFAELRKLAMFI